MAWRPGSRIKRKLREIIEARDGTNCRHCGRPTVPAPSPDEGITLPPETRTLDHYPKTRAQGASDEPENLVISCLECNQRMNHFHLMRTSRKYRKAYNTKGWKKPPPFLQGG